MVIRVFGFRVSGYQAFLGYLGFMVIRFWGLGFMVISFSGFRVNGYHCFWV